MRRIIARVLPGAALLVGASQILGQTHIAAIGAGAAPANCIFLATNGNDATGVRGSSASFLTPMAAINAAQAGDVIYVTPGTYFTGTNLAKNGVTWMFSGPSCIFTNFALDANPPSTNAMFSDIDGATNFAVLGYPTIQYNTGTDWFSTIFGTHPIAIGATNANFGILLTNANTMARFQINDMQWYSYFSPTNVTTVGPIQINNCSNAIFNVLSLEDEYQSQSYVVTNRKVFSYSSTSAAFVWLLGNVTFDFDYIGRFSTYGIWCYEPGSPFTNSLYVHGREMDSKIYVEATDNSYRTWLDIDWINCSNAPGRFAIATQGGFNYITSKKISDSVLGCVNNTAGTLWLTAQKLESPVQWILATGGNLYATVANYADSGAVSNGITISGGANLFEGGGVSVSNGNAVYFTGGNATLKHMTIDTTAGGAAGDYPVQVAAPGLVLEDCQLLAPPAAPSIFASSPQKVNLEPASYFSTQPAGAVTLNATNNGISTYAVPASLPPGQAYLYNYFPFSATNCAFDFKTVPVSSANSASATIFFTNAWLYQPGGGTNEMVAITFTPSVNYTATGIGAATVAAPMTVTFTNSTSGQGFNKPSPPVSEAMNGQSVTAFYFFAGVTGYSIGSTNSSSGPCWIDCYGSGVNF